MVQLIFRTWLCSACLCSCSMPDATYTPAQRLLPDPLRDGYVPAHAAAESGMLLNEFTKSGDSIKNWERLVTRLHVSQPGIAEGLARKTAADLKRDCPHAKVEFGKVAAGEFSVEHSHNGCGPWEGHRSIRKFINGHDGVYMLAFDMKNRAYAPA